MDFTTSTSTPPAVASDLSKLCLPQEYKDSNRRLAWANSICFLFLVIGFIGLKPPPVHIRALSEVVDIVPVIITPAEEQEPPPPTEEKPTEEPTPDAAPEAPVVATVVTANPAAAAFAVPVEGPVVLAPAHLAAPPPQNLKPPPSNKPAVLQSSEEDWGGKSNQPEYPGMAQRNGYQGVVTLEITFDASGAVSDVKVLKSSGYNILDNAAVDKVKKGLRLRSPPGETKVYTKDFSFRLR